MRTESKAPLSSTKEHAIHVRGCDIQQAFDWQYCFQIKTCSLRRSKAKHIVDNGCL